MLTWEEIWLHSRNCGLFLYAVVLFKPVILGFASTLRETSLELFGYNLISVYPFISGIITGILGTQIFYILPATPPTQNDFS